jgi:hypothetical protein
VKSRTAPAAPLLGLWPCNHAAIAKDRLPPSRHRKRIGVVRSADWAIHGNYARRGRKAVRRRLLQQRGHRALPAKRASSNFCFARGVKALEACGHAHVIPQ